ncbi:hypothetical protein QQF64_018426 [Cirrhinus molitorella]|uniref:Uncharacterized protein n=1 Tax=Cirrhinus molitorella TaxID=172907 RepID=A0ABR3LE40_9TELE
MQKKANHESGPKLSAGTNFHLDRYLTSPAETTGSAFVKNDPVQNAPILLDHSAKSSLPQDYKVSYPLRRPVRPSYANNRCNPEHQHGLAPVRALTLYLLLCLESAVHRGPRTVTGECQGRDAGTTERMLMEDFSLSPEIVLHCRGEIEAHCSGLHRKGRTLHCS